MLVLVSSSVYRLDVFRNGISLRPVLWAPRFTSSYLGGVFWVKDSFVAPYILYFEVSTPLPVHRMRMHLDPNGGSFAEEFRCLATIRIGCLSSQSWIMGEYLFVI